MERVRSSSCSGVSSATSGSRRGGFGGCALRVSKGIDKAVVEAMTDGEWRRGDSAVAATRWRLAEVNEDGLAWTLERSRAGVEQIGGKWRATKSVLCQVYARQSSSFGVGGAHCGGWRWEWSDPQVDLRVTARES